MCIRDSLTTATDLEMVVGANCVDTLVEYDNKGVMREGLATKWEWDADTLTSVSYTHLRRARQL